MYLLIAEIIAAPVALVLVGLALTVILLFIVVVLVVVFGATFGVVATVGASGMVRPDICDWYAALKYHPGAFEVLT